MKSNIVHYQRFKQFKFSSLFLEGFCIFTDSVYIIYTKTIPITEGKTMCN